MHSAQGMILPDWSSACVSGECLSADANRGASMEPALCEDAWGYSVTKAWQQGLAAGCPQQWQQAVVAQGYCGGAGQAEGQVVWVPLESLQPQRQPMQQQEAPYQLPQRPQPEAACPRPQGAPQADAGRQAKQQALPMGTVHQLLKSLQLQVPESVKVMQKQYNQQQELHRQQQHPQQPLQERTEQLLQQLSLIQQMQQQLLAQAEEVLQSQIDGGKPQQQQQQQQQQWSGPGAQPFALLPQTQQQQQPPAPQPQAQAQAAAAAWGHDDRVPGHGCGWGYHWSPVKESPEAAAAGEEPGPGLYFAPGPGPEPRDATKGPGGMPPKAPFGNSTQRPPPLQGERSGEGGGRARAGRALRGEGTEGEAQRRGTRPASKAATVTPPEAGAAERAARGAAPQDMGSNTMKSQLQALQQEAPETVFIARRINKLGFTSAERLRSHFGSYGQVKCVHVSHSRVKTMRPDTHWRMRAASLGFVVMVSPEATARILAEGPEHLVGEVLIRVHTFRRHSLPDDGAEQDESDGQEEPEAVLAQPGPPPAPQADAGAGVPCAPPFCGALPISSLARFSPQELYNAQPELYED
mmetsp:Transcript_30511/g.91637  ORF Transcript_30511/g.91637 Transcript_30511/m.91637 type:complete len:580 (+) Transcript_30511:87-1826(+)